jgi:hypothetical protein
VPDITQLSSGQPIFFAVAFFLVSNPYLAAIATDYYCCRYWNFYFGGKLLANLGMENIVFFGTYSIH